MQLANTFAGLLPLVLQFDDLKNDSAPGENFATSYGVTEFTWYNAINEGIVDNKPFEDATRDDCITILRVDYFNRCRIMSLPPGIGLMVFNDAVLTGAGHAAKLLQRIVGAVADGAVGPVTISKVDEYVGHYSVKKLIDALYTADTDYLAALNNAPKMIGGWTRRENTVRAAAYNLAKITV